MEPAVPQPGNTTDDTPKSSKFNATKFKELLKKLAARKTSG